MTAFAKFGTRPDVILPLLFFLICIYAPSGFNNPNTLPRVGLSHSILTKKQLNIDEIAPFTADKAFRDGHYYCDKAPGISFICIPAVAVMNRLADAVGLDQRLISPIDHPPFRVTHARYLALALSCLAAVTMLTAWGVACFYRTLRAADVDTDGAIVATFSFAFGTQYLMWSTAVFGHAVAAALLFMAFAQYWAVGKDAESARWRLPMAGLLLGWAVMVEFTAAIPAAIIGITLLAATPRPSLQKWLGAATLMAAGGFVPILLLLAYNNLVFGSPFSVGYGAVQGFSGMKNGFFGITPPDPAVLWAITFSAYRGILWLSPVLAVAFIAMWALLASTRHRVPMVAALLVVIYYFCLNAGYYYWDGGFSTGPRHVTPAVPFLMLGLGLAWARLSSPVRWLVIALSAYGVAVVMMTTLVNILAPNDGKAMLWGHVVPMLLQGRANLPAHQLGLPYGTAFWLPFIGLAFAAWLLRRYPARQGALQPC
mgnify:CR=1 FL=1